MTFTHQPHVSLTWFTFCWLHHSWLLMTSQLPDSCDVSTWKVISNSLDIDFIHSDIHGRSCNKMGFQSWLKTLRSEQNGRHFADVFKCIFLNESCCILIQILAFNVAFFISEDRRPCTGCSCQRPRNPMYLLWTLCGRTRCPTWTRCTTQNTMPSQYNSQYDVPL